MPMYINLGTYINQLKAIESTKPANERRKIPSMTELANVAGVHQTTLSRITSNKVRQFNLDIGDKIITEMRRRGFPMQVADLIVYIPDETNPQNQTPTN